MSIPIIDRLKLGIATGALSVLATGAVQAQQALSPYSTFSSLTAGQLAGAQVRFTFVGEHTGRGLPTMALTTTGGTVDLSPFDPFYRPGFQYDGDEFPAPTLTVSAAELVVMLDSVATLPGVTDGNIDSLGYLSFGITAVVGGQPESFEAILNKANATDLFTKLLQATLSNVEVSERIARHACMLGALRSPKTIIVDDKVEVTLRGFRRIRGTKEFVGRVRVKNISGSNVATPLVVSLEPGMDMKILNPSGFTCHVQPGGVPFIRLPATSALAPGQSTDAVVRLLNPGLHRVRLDFARAFVDSGGR